MNDIQTLLIEADEQTRVALRVALRSQPGIEVASEATNGTTGLVLLESIDVDVAIVDACLPDMSVAEFIQQMRILQADAGVTASKLLILSDRRDRQSLLEVTAGQVEGCCRKELPIGEMAEIIRQIYAGGQFLDPAIAESLSPTSTKADPDDLFNFKQRTVFT